MSGAALVLAVYALAAGVLAPALLRRGWAWRAPRFAIGLWMVLSLSWITAAALAIVAVAAPFLLTWARTRSGDGAALAADSPGPTLAGGAGLLLAGAVLARAGGCVASGLARARGERRRHAAFLQTAGLPDHALGVVVLDQDAPTAYCLPGSGRRIVVSTGALAALTRAQLQAVLAHERAHLAGHHHLLLAVVSALRHAFPFVPLLSQAEAQVATLAEMAADDAAARRHDRGDLAAALVLLATTRSRAATLTAGGPAAIARIQRLLDPPRLPGRPARIARLAAGAAAFTFPAVIACLPLVAAACDIVARP